MWLTWKSWTCTPNPMIPNVRWSALTRHPPSCWPIPVPLRQLRKGCPQPAWPVSGGEVAVERRCKTSPAGVGWWMKPTRKQAVGSWDNLNPIAGHRCTRLSRLRKPGGLPGGWSFITRPSTANIRVHHVPLLPEEAALRRSLRREVDALVTEPTPPDGTPVRG